MAINVGIVGLGFMGKCHFDTLQAMRGVKVAAICDVDPKKRAGDWSSIMGNIDTGKNAAVGEYTPYEDFDELLANDKIDTIDITLPTYLHADYAIRALKANKNVICEKPLARTSAEAKKIVTAAGKSTGRLFVAQCIRYWPAYAKAAEIIRKKKYGRVLTACFRRFSPTPLWSWENWLQDDAKSGLCALDLHVHDADFILYAMGAPQSVRAVAGGFEQGRIDHIHATYNYGDDGPMVTAEGAWEHASGFPFSMTFSIDFEKGTLAMAADTSLMYYPRKCKPRKVATDSKSGYQLELADFIRCIRTGCDSKIVTPESAAQSVKLVELEVKAARSGRNVPVKL